MLEDKFFGRIKREFVKYRLLLLVLVVVPLPLPIVMYFKEVEKADNLIRNFREGEVSKVSLVSEIDTTLPNTRRIEYERKIFPIILKRKMSYEEEVNKVIGFMELFCEKSYSNSRVKFLSELPREWVTNVIYRFLSETVVVDSSRLPDGVLWATNVVVVFGTNIYSPKYVIFFPVNSPDEVKKALKVVFGEALIPPLDDALSYLILGALSPNAVFDPSLQEAEFRRYLKIKNVPLGVRVRKGEEIVSKGVVINKGDVEVVRSYFSDVLGRVLVKSVLLEVIIAFLAIFSVLVLSVLRNVRNHKILAINTAFLLVSLYPQFFLKAYLGANSLIVSFFIAFLLINSLISGRRSTSVVGVYYILVLLFTVSLSYLVVTYWIALAVVMAVMSYRMKKRTDFIVIASVIFFLSVVSYFAAYYVEFLDGGRVLDGFVISFITVFSNVLLVFLVLPVYEYFFRVATPFRLYELSSLDNPLLRMLLERAPGTYYHSLNVSILAESAAEAINANSLLAKVGALYHDIGKIENPDVFTENIGGKTREDIDPYRYTEIIKSHPHKGVEIARRHRLPVEIERIIAEHHGSGIITYFYSKAHRENPRVDIEFFRYKTPSPSSRESAIVFICDKIEARIRSLSNQPIHIESLYSEIENTIYNQMIADELSKSELTLRDLNEIKRAIKETYTYTLHQRIEYPKV